MLNRKVAEHIKRGELDQAVEACMEDLMDVMMKDMETIKAEKGEDYARDRATELIWIAAAYARIESWEMGREYARLSNQIYEPTPGTSANLYGNLLFIAGDPSLENCEKSRIVLQSGIIDEIEKDMYAAFDGLGGISERATVKDAKETELAQASNQIAFSMWLGGVHTKAFEAIENGQYQLAFGTANTGIAKIEEELSADSGAAGDYDYFLAAFHLVRGMYYDNLASEDDTDSLTLAQSEYAEALSYPPQCYETVPQDIRPTIKNLKQQVDAKLSPQTPVSGVGIAKSALLGLLFGIGLGIGLVLGRAIFGDLWAAVFIAGPIASLGTLAVSDVFLRTNFIGQDGCSGDLVKRLGYGLLAVLIGFMVMRVMPMFGLFGLFGLYGSSFILLASILLSILSFVVLSIIIGRKT